MKGFIGLPVLLGILLVLALSGGAYWYMQQKYPAPAFMLGGQEEASTTEPSGTPPPNSGTFKSVLGNAFPMAFEYPGNWDVVYNDGRGMRFTSSSGSLDISISQFGDLPAAEALAPELNQGDFSGGFIPTGLGGQQGIELDGKNIGPSTPGSVVVYTYYQGSVYRLLFGNVTTAEYNHFFRSFSFAPHANPGMNEYTDADFGFSLWYPADQTLQDVSGTLFANGFVFGRSDTQILKQLQIDNVQITEIYSPAMAVRTFADIGDPWGTGATVTYYFSPPDRAWMAAWVGWQNSHNIYATTTADVSRNTMGGLHMLPVSAKWDDAVLVPLSAHNFLFIEDQAGTAEATPLASTILALDPAVATPRSPAVQQQTIAAEEQVFAAVHAPPPPVTQKSYASSQWKFSLSYPSDFADASKLTILQQHQVASYMGACPTEPDSYHAGVFALCYVGPDKPSGFATASFIVSATSSVPESTCLHLNGGITYSEGETSKAPTPIVINGTTFYKDSWGDAGLGHYESADTYNAYRNGICYGITLDTESYRVEGNFGDFSPIENELDSMLKSFTLQ